MAKDIIVPIEIQSIDTAGIGAGAYSEIGNPLEGALAFIRITNTSNTDVYISYDGVNDHEFIPATNRISSYFQVNSSPTNHVSKLRKETMLYIRGVAGVGLVYVSGYYNG